MARLAYVLGDSDPEGAIYWDTRAAELGYVPSMCNLAARLADTTPENAERWWLRATELGSLTAMGGLAWLYKESRPTEADRWRQRAAAAGYAPAILWYAMEARQMGDRRSALAWYEKGASVGDARAM